MFAAAYQFLRLRGNQWLKHSELHKLQNRNVRWITRHAYETVPYYHRLFKQNNVRPDDIKTVDDLKKLPVTSKEDIRDLRPHDGISNKWSIKKLHKDATSGSTGYPLNLFRTGKSYDISRAVKLRNFFRNGYRLQDKIAVLHHFESKPKLHYKFGLHQMRTIPHSIPLRAQADLFLEERFAAIEGFANRINLLGEELINHKRDTSFVRNIFCDSETLSFPIRKRIEKSFGVNPVNIYSSREFANIACECQAHEGLHIESDLLHLEILSTDDIQACEGEEGQVVITDFVNPAMPLIRYNIGDIAVHTNHKCSCGITLPLIKDIYGRMNDYLTTPDGNKISSLNAIRNIHPYWNKIIQFKAHQKKDGTVILQVVLKEGEKLPEAEIIHILNRDCGGCPIKIRYVSEIKISKAGKFTHFSSEIE